MAIRDKAWRASRSFSTTVDGPRTSAPMTTEKRFRALICSNLAEPSLKASQAAPLGKALESLGPLGDDLDRDALLDAFLSYTTELGIELYPAQEEAILELLSWRHVILNTPTGSGKSLVAQFLQFQALAEQRVCYYTTPIKALANEKFFDLCDLFGPENVGLITGDASVNRDAPIICCTAEVLANIALRDSELLIDYVVMDEFHYYGDRDRGMAWQIPLITLRDTVFLLMSATLGDVSEIAKRLDEFTDRQVSVVVGTDRPVPLEFDYRETITQETVQSLVDEQRAPIYLVNFTQRACSEQAQNLTSIRVATKEQRKAVSKRIEGFRFDTPFGKELSRFLRSGIGVHHAGLLPKYRLLVEQLAQAGLLQVVSGTDSLGVGVNVPIRTVLFRQLCKFNGEKTAILTAREFHQIAGRAGRRGFDDVGYVVAQSPEHVAENRKIEAKLILNPHLKKKLRKKKPPTRGYVHWDRATFDKLRSSRPEPLTPTFQVDHGMLIQVLQSETDEPGGGYGRLVRIIERAHLRDVDKSLQRRRAAELFRSLRSVGVIELVDSPRGRVVRVSGELQKDFSLHQALSLYLVEVVELLDQQSETYAVDVLSLVEAILENPDILLRKQVDKLKGELVAKLKAEGVEYEERMEQLEQVEYPKPNAEFIYETFNLFAKNHPWVGQENIKPKSVARDMFEKAMSFNDYVREYGLARSEGVLLRYLSQVYKTAVQNVPDSAKTESFEQLVSFLRTIIKRVDSSLIDAWERMMRGELVVPQPAEQMEEHEPSPVDLAKDPKALIRRIRNEAHLLLRALSRKDFEAACELVRWRQDDPWTAERFEQALAPFFDEHEGIDVSPRARYSEYTIIEQQDAVRWKVSQKILDLAGEADWVIEGVVDLQTMSSESDPLLVLERIGP